MKKIYIGGRMFKQMLAVYCAVLMIFFVLLSINLQERKSEIRKIEIESDNQGVADTIVRNIDSKFEVFNSLSSAMGNLSWVKHAMSDSQVLSSELTSWKKMEIRNQFDTYRNALQVAEDFAIVFPQKNQVVNAHSWWDMSSYLKSIGVPGNSYCEEIYNDLLSNEEYAVFSMSTNKSNDDYSGILLIKRIDVTDVSRAKAVLYISNVKLSRFIPAGVQSLSISSSDDVIYSYTDHRTDSKDNVNTYKYVSDFANIVYEISIGTHNYSDTKVMTYIGLTFCSIILALGVGYLLARISYHPVYKLMDYLHLGVNRNENEYEMIAQHYDEVISEKNNLERIASDYIVAARNEVLYHLLTGEYNEQKLPEQLKRLSIPFECDDKFWLFKCTDSSVHTTYSGLGYYLKLTELFEQLRIPAVLLERSESDIVVFLYSKNEQTLLERAEVTYQHLSEIQNDTIDILQSEDLISDVFSINCAYQQMKESLLHHVGAQRREDSSLYYCPLDWEIQMIKYLRYGNAESVLRIMDKLYNENMRVDGSPACMNDLCGFLKGILARVYSEMFGQKLELHLMTSDRSNQQEFEHNWDLIRKQCVQLCENVQKRNSIENNEEVVQIKEYIDANYTKYDLTQQAVADRFKMTPSALSKLFRNAFGLNFTDYLQGLRIRQAIVLMDERKMSITDIARSVGYENDITFRRAFQKITMMTPGQYLRKNTMDNKDGDEE